MSRTVFGTTGTLRAGFVALTSAIRIVAALLALAAIGMAIAVSISEDGTPSARTPVVLVNSTTDTTPTGTGTAASAPTSQAAPVYQGPPPQTWARVTQTAQPAPQTYVLTATPRPAPCPYKKRLCQPVHF